MSNSIPWKSRRINPWLLIVWLVGVGAGIAALIAYDLRAGTTGSPPAAWPVGSRLPRNMEGPTLVMFAHPHCPCTRASLAELKCLLETAEVRAAAIVAFIQPEEATDEWVNGPLWDSVASAPGIICVTDFGQREAAIFGAFTSGHVLLFDGSGRLQYSGGITLARGHDGANAGAAAVAACLAGNPRQQPSLPVFGCPLFDSDEHRGRGELPCRLP